MRTNETKNSAARYEAPQADVFKISVNAPLMLSGGGTIGETGEEEG